MLKFVHFADVHLGSWRENKLKNLNFKTFEEVINNILKEKIDFVVISGDLFDIPMPDLEILKKTMNLFKKLKEKNVPIYIIGGSHDYSLSNNSFLEILDISDLVTLVDKKVIKKENYLITGINGKKKSLDSLEYKYLKEEILNKKKEHNNLFSIFLFHINVKDFTNLNYDGITKNMLPKGFNYYAGGHIHKHFLEQNENYTISYPGPLFPNNFKELKEIKPSYNIVEVDKNKKISVKNVKISNYEKFYINENVENKKPENIKRDLLNIIDNNDLKNKIVLLDLSGIIDGKTSDIEINKITDYCYEKGAFVVLRNTLKLKSKELIDLSNKEEEKNFENFIKEKIEKIRTLQDKNIDKKIIKELIEEDFEKKEEERNVDYEDRVVKIFEKIFNKNLKDYNF